MTYRTSVSDPFLRLISFVIVAFIGMVLVFSLIGLYSVWIVLALYLVVMAGLSFYLMKVLSAAMVETELLGDRLRLKWLKHNIFNTYTDEDILFEDVQEDGFMTSKISKVYTLFLKTGREFSYKQFNWFTPRREDLEVMGRDIRQAIERYNAQNPQPWRPDGYEKTRELPLTEEENKVISTRLYISVFAIIAIYLLVGFPVLKMSFPAASFMWDLKVLGILTTIILLLSKVYGSIHDRREKAKGELPGEQ